MDAERSSPAPVVSVRCDVIESSFACCRPRWSMQEWGSLPQHDELERSLANGVSSTGKTPLRSIIGIETERTTSRLTWRHFARIATGLSIVGSNPGATADARLTLPVSCSNEVPQRFGRLSMRPWREDCRDPRLTHAVTRGPRRSPRSHATEKSTTTTVRSVLELRRYLDYASRIILAFLKSGTVNSIEVP